MYAAFPFADLLRVNYSFLGIRNKTYFGIVVVIKMLPAKALNFITKILEVCRKVIVTKL